MKASKRSYKVKGKVQQIERTIFCDTFDEAKSAKQFLLKLNFKDVKIKVL